MKVVALAGGTGSAKLLRGLASVESDLTVVTNVGDDIWMHGLFVCPDIDTAMYTLAGVADKGRGWGIGGDTFTTLKQLGGLGVDTWFALGDKDMATHIIRTRALKEGRTLTQVTADMCRRYKVRERILPATDSRVETKILTRDGEMNLQEFWVERHGKPSVSGVRYDGATGATATREVAQALAEADSVIICPANPVSSIGPMLAIADLRKALVATQARVSALSPMIGTAPFSGPAGKLMKASGTSPDSLGVAALYLDFLDAIVISRKDSGMVRGVERLGIRCHLSDTTLDSPADERRLARELLEA